VNWYYADGEQQVGPLSEAEFAELVQAGKIQPDTLVWHEGMDNWEPHGRIAAPPPATPAAAAPAPAQGGIICSECGAAFGPDDVIRYGDVWVCAACKPVFVQKLKEGAALGGAMNYAGFGVRFGAKFIDGAILWVVQMVVGFAFGMATSGIVRQRGAFSPQQILLVAIQYAFAAAYATWFIGKFGATPGKMACKLCVVTSDGGKVSYARALGRHFSEYLSSLILCIGYLMVAFDKEQRRALHDRICNTRVIRR